MLKNKKKTIKKQQIFLEDQDNYIKKAADKKGIYFSEMVREMVDYFIANHPLK